MTIDALPQGPPIDGFTVLYDYDGSGNLIYQGWARSIVAGGPVAANKVWIIQKNTYNVSNLLTQQQWANGLAPNVLNAWSERTTLTYQ
jgi:putative AlgH/UPF0301 family transcriptional regulator